jgi:hypothetical protein
MFDERVLGNRSTMSKIAFAKAVVRRCISTSHGCIVAPFSSQLFAFSFPSHGVGHGHRRAHPEGPRRVGGRRYDAAPFGATAHSEGPSLQRRVALLFDRAVKLIEVKMNDGSFGRSGGHRDSSGTWHIGREIIAYDGRH